MWTRHRRLILIGIAVLAIIAVAIVVSILVFRGKGHNRHQLETAGSYCIEMQTQDISLGKLMNSHTPQSKPAWANGLTDDGIADWIEDTCGDGHIEAVIARLPKQRTVVVPEAAAAVQIEAVVAESKQRQTEIAEDRAKEDARQAEWQASIQQAQEERQQREAVETHLRTTYIRIYPLRKFPVRNGQWT